MFFLFSSSLIFQPFKAVSFPPVMSLLLSPPSSPNTTKFRIFAHIYLIHSAYNIDLNYLPKKNIRQTGMCFCTYALLPCALMPLRLMLLWLMCPYLPKKAVYFHF